MLVHFALSQDLPAQVLGHFALSQDYLLKCWETSYCPRTFRSSVGTPRTSQDLFVLVLGTSYCPKTSHSSVGTLRTVPRLPAQVLRHFVLSQDPSLKRWDTSHCPKTSLIKSWDTSHCPKTLRLSVGTLRTVPRPPTQVLGHPALSQDPSFKCWDSRISSSSVLGHLDHYPRYHHLSSSIKISPKPNLTDQ